MCTAKKMPAAPDAVYEFGPWEWTTASNSDCPAAAARLQEKRQPAGSQEPLQKAPGGPIVGQHIPQIISRWGGKPDKTGGDLSDR
jgi:hypothetical protein